MFVKNLICVLLLAYLVNIATGSPYRRKQSAPRGRSSYAWPAAKQENNDDDKNEYAVIHEARKSRHNSSPFQPAVRTKSFSRNSPFGQRSSSHNSPFRMKDRSAYSSTDLGYTGPKSLNPERRVFINPSSAPEKSSNTRKIGLTKLDDIDYAY